NRRFELGETNYLEKITARARQRELELELKQAETEVTAALTNLKKLVQTDEDFTIAETEMEMLELTRFNVEQHVLKQIYEQRISLAEAENSVEKQRLLPEITFSYFR